MSLSKAANQNLTVTVPVSPVTAVVDSVPPDNKNLNSNSKAKPEKFSLAAKNLGK